MADKERAIGEALNYYLTEPERIFPLQIKSMRLMEGQSFSGYRKEKYPKFNGAIWADHWLQPPRMKRCWSRTRRSDEARSTPL